MKKYFVLLIIGIILQIQSAHAVSIKGRDFVFPKGPTEWSDPIELTLQSVKMEKNGDAPVKISVRIKAVRKILMGCRYELEVTNTDTRGLRFNIVGYDKALGFKLKPGKSDNGVLDSFTKGCKGIESCGDCYFNLTFDEIIIMK